MTSPSGPRVVAIGGGHGLAMSLRAVRSYAGRLTAVVATGDDGGSSGRVRAEIDMPAPGDLRRCLTAIAPDRELADALEHRFGGHGHLAGHAVGNLVLAGLVDAGLDLAAASSRVAAWLGVDLATTQVMPATTEPVCLVVTTDDGDVRGQVEAEQASGVRHIATDPPTPAVPAAVIEAIAAADQIVLGPGSFFTSVLATAAVPGIRDALASSPARLVFVVNLRPDDPQVADVAGHVAALAAHGVHADVVVAQDGALPVGDVDGPEVQVADVDRPHGLAHDSELLGRVLAALV